MPYEFTFDKPPAGYVLENAEPGQQVKIAVREFTSSEDGERFVSRLEGIPSDIVARLNLPDKVWPSTIDHLVAIVNPDGVTKVYANECGVLVKIRAARSIQAGEAVREDDIVDVDGLRFEGVECPETAGFLCVFSSGWRKGLFFDFTPLGPGNPKRAYDLERLLGSYFAYLMNQAVSSLTEEHWQLMFNQRWFPFVSLPKRLVRILVAAVRGGQQIDHHLGEIADAIRRMTPELRARWSQAELLAPHLPLLLHALDKYVEGDYISATSVLYPRIEGVLRSMHEVFGGSAKPTAKRLSGTAGETGSATHEHSWLLPAMFSRFLEEVYFADFQPGLAAQISRHSVGHGVASARDFDLKSASIGVLIIDQLRFMIPGEPANTY